MQVSDVALPELTLEMLKQERCLQSGLRCAQCDSAIMAFFVVVDKIIIRLECPEGAINCPNMVVGRTFIEPFAANASD